MLKLLGSLIGSLLGGDEKIRSYKSAKLAKTLMTTLVAFLAKLEVVEIL
jgi:hypothetical protein